MKVMLLETNPLGNKNASPDADFCAGSAMTQTRSWLQILVRPTATRTARLLASLLFLFGVSVCTNPALAADSPVKLQAQSFPLQDVRLLDGPFYDAMSRDKAYLLRLEPDRFLHTFRLNAGFPSTAKPYGGWEEPKGELRGHSLGHYLSACSLMYASTGDAQLKSRVDGIVTELAKCQAASPSQGFHPGYISAFPESFIDRVEKRSRSGRLGTRCTKSWPACSMPTSIAAITQALEVLTNDGRLGQVPRGSSVATSRCRSRSTPSSAA